MKKLKILKTDNGIVSKFLVEDRKLKIYKYEDSERFFLWATKPNCRYFHPIKGFCTLEDAERFIYTDEAFNLMPW